MSNAFIRSKIKNTEQFAKLLAKISGIKSQKPNAFNVDYQGNRFVGESMTVFDLTTSPTAITFTSGGLNYSFLIADLQLVKRIRYRKYVFKVNVLSIV